MVKEGKKKAWKVNWYGVGKVPEPEVTLDDDHKDALNYLYESRGWGNTANYHPESAGIKYNADGSEIESFNTPEAYKHEAVFQELVNRGLAEARRSTTQIYHGDRKLGRKATAEYHLTKKGEEFAERERQERESDLVLAATGTRVAAFVFFVAGLSFAVASDFSSTGHAIANEIPSLASLPAFLSILLAAIGGYLFIKSK